MKDTPPSVARATARRSPETDCMMAETIGMFIMIFGVSPFLNFTRGVFRLTFAGIHSAEEYPGIRRYSLKVCAGSLIKVAITFSVSLKSFLWFYYNIPA